MSRRSCTGATRRWFGARSGSQFYAAPSSSESYREFACRPNQDLGRGSEQANVSDSRVFVQIDVEVWRLPPPARGSPNTKKQIVTRYGGALSMSALQGSTSDLLVASSALTPEQPFWFAIQT